MAKPKSIKPVGESLSIQMMVHGAPGIGKTSFVGTGGEGTLIIRPPTEHLDPIVGTGCEEWIVGSWSEMLEDVIEYLQHEGDQWKWVWLDSISAWQDVGLDDIWRGVLDRRPDRKGGPIDKGEYGLNMTRVQQWVRHVSGMSSAGNFHFGITAHSQELWDEQAEAELMKPWIQGKMMSDKVMGYMNLVAYMELVKNRRVFRFNLTDEYYAKDQFNAFSNGRLVDPTVPKVVSAINKARGSKPTTKKKRATRRGAKA